MTAGKKILLGLGLAAAAVAAAVFLLRPSGPKGAALDSRERAMEMLGACIARLQPDCQVLVLSNPFARESGYLDQTSQYERAGLGGLRRGLGGRIPVTVVFPEIRPEYLAHPEAVIVPPDSRTPLSFVMKPDSVERLAGAHPDCRVIVSLIGLPVGVDQLKLWDDKDPRCFALLLPDLRVLGPPEKAAEAFQRGKLLAAVAEDSRSGVPLLVTRSNVVEVLERQPEALGY